MTIRQRAWASHRRLPSLLVAAIALVGCSSSAPADPPIALDQAHSRLEALFEGTARAVSPRVEWIKDWYDIYPEYSGLCGTQGCKETGLAEFEGTRWVRTRVAAARQSAFVDQVSTFWQQQGHAVTRRGLELEAQDARQSVHLEIYPDTGCIAVRSRLLNVASARNPYAPQPDTDGGKSCGTLNDPYWSG